jgi:hypothetical protein
MKMDPPKFKIVLPYKIIGVIILLISISLTIKNFIYLITYNSHQGYTENVFGYPTEFKVVLFYTIFFTIVTVSSILIIKAKKLGWYISQIGIFSAIILLLFAIISSYYTSLDYNSIEFILLLVFLLWISNNLNSKYFLKALAINRKLTNYIVIFSGVILLGFASFWLLKSM